MLTLTPPKSWSLIVSGVRCGTDPLMVYMKQPGVSITRLLEASTGSCPVKDAAEEFPKATEFMATVPRRAADSCVDWRMMLKVSGDI